MHLIAGGASTLDVAPAAAAAIVRRFSTLALVAVGGLDRGWGRPLDRRTSDGPRGLIGTTYGLMVAHEDRAARRAARPGRPQPRRRPGRAGRPVAVALRRLMEVELGLGFTVLFAAASLTSLPPAVDVVADRAAPAEVLERFTPRWPSFTSPPIEAVPVDRRRAADRRRSSVVRVQPPRQRAVRARDGGPGPPGAGGCSRGRALATPVRRARGVHGGQERPRGVATRVGRASGPG